MLDLAEGRVAGVFNGTGPAGMTTMGELLGAAVEATGSGARLRWVPDAALRALGVEPWTELPLWAPEDEMAGTWRIGTERAQAAGLRCRPAAETVADVAAWLRDGGEAELSDWGSHARPAPMSAEREAELLALGLARGSSRDGGEVVVARGPLAGVWVLLEGDLRGARSPASRLPPSAS